MLHNPLLCGHTGSARSIRSSMRREARDLVIQHVQHVQDLMAVLDKA